MASNQTSPSFLTPMVTLQIMGFVVRDNNKQTPNTVAVPKLVKLALIERLKEGFEGSDNDVFLISNTSLGSR